MNRTVVVAAGKTTVTTSAHPVSKCPTMIVGFALVTGTPAMAGAIAFETLTLDI